MKVEFGLYIQLFKNFCSVYLGYHLKEQLMMFLNCFINKRTLSVAAGVLFSVISISSSYAEVTFDTSQSEFSSGVLNQGWWSDSSVGNIDSNDNHATGNSRGTELRSFYTFDLSTLSGVATSATLRVKRGFQSPSVTLALWDVSTAAAALNNNDGTSAAIFADLGSGNSYGSFAVFTRISSVSGDYLSFSLNSQALADINAAGGFFSIGASIPGTLTSGESIFLSTGGDVTYLDITTAPVPEPETYAMLLAGLGLLGFASRRRKQDLAA